MEANYRFDFEDLPLTAGLADWGGLSFNLQGSFLNNYKITTLPGDQPFDCAGLYGSICTGAAVPAGAPLPEWRHKFKVSWRAPARVELSATWRYMGKVDVDQEFSGASHANGPDKVLKAQNYIDFAGAWGVRDNIRLRFGVNNVFDKDPPLVSSGGGAVNNCPTGPCNGNTFPQAYDAIGRFLFVGVRADF